MQTLRRSGLALLLLALIATGCSGGLSRPDVSAQSAPKPAPITTVSPFSLPAPAELAELLSPARRRISASSFELLALPPVLQSAGASSVWSSGSLGLDCQQLLVAEQFSWAIFSLGGLPPDQSTYPVQIDVTKTGLAWLAAANFSSGRWELVKLYSSGQMSLPGGADFISPAGAVFVALIACPWETNLLGQASCSSLTVQFNQDLPAGPTAALNLLTPAPLSGSPVEFDALGSLPGDGSFTQLSYDFGDGSALETDTDPAAVHAHTYADFGTYTVTLTVEADVFGVLKTDSVSLDVFVDLPGAPTATINLASQRYATEYPVSVDGIGSDPGLGVFTEISYDFGDGSPAVTAPDPVTPVEHTYDTAGDYSITLTVKTDQGGIPRQASASVDVSVGPSFKEMLLVYNSDMPQSLELAQYYASPETGRAISPALLLGVALTQFEEGKIDRADYETLIRDPVKDFIGSAGIEDSLKYILLFKGVPHRINGTNDEFSDSSDYSSVDSELCTLFSDGTYPLDGWLWNASEYYSQDCPTGSFYLGVNPSPLSRNYNFRHGGYQLTDLDDNLVPLDYLVGRLSAYTFDDAKAIVDRSLAADTSGTGWAILDSSDELYGGVPLKQLDTMVDPVWPFLGDAPQSGYEYLYGAGFNVVQDLTSAHLTVNGGLPPGAAQNVLLYCGWGIHSGFSQTYILDELGFTYLPGAAFMSYESFNGTDFNSGDGISRRGQGQVCDFLAEGGTVGLANAWEPFTHGTGDERAVFYRYAVSGDRWIEAAYKGLRLLSWQEVVVGDPLCRVKP